METVVLTLAIFFLALAGLGLGQIFRRGGIKGSCGGEACRNACHACPRKTGGKDA